MNGSSTDHESSAAARLHFASSLLLLDKFTANIDNINKTKQSTPSTKGPLVTTELVTDHAVITAWLASDIGDDGITITTSTVISNHVTGRTSQIHTHSLKSPSSSPRNKKEKLRRRRSVSCVSSDSPTVAKGAMKWLMKSRKHDYFCEPQAFARSPSSHATRRSSLHSITHDKLLSPKKEDLLPSQADRNAMDTLKWIKAQTKSKSRRKNKLKHGDNERNTTSKKHSRQDAPQKGNEGLIENVETTQDDAPNAYKYDGYSEIEMLNAKLSCLLCEQLLHVKPFEHLDYNTQRRLVEKMTLIHLEPGEYICRQGETATQFYFIVTGKVKVTRKHQSKDDYLYPSKFFGEITLAHNNCKCTGNCISDGKQGTTLLCLNKVQFEESMNTKDTPTWNVPNTASKTNMTVSVADYSFMGGVFARFEQPIISRRMPALMNTIASYTERHSSRKMALAIVLRNTLNTPTGSRSKEQIVFLMCVLSETPFFQRHLCCNVNQTAGLCQHLKYRTIQKDESLYTLGDIGDTVSVVLGGKLIRYSLLGGKGFGSSTIGGNGSSKGGDNVSHPNNSNDRTNHRPLQKELPVKKSFIGSGNAAGLVALQGARIRINSVVAAVDTELLVLDVKKWFAIRGLGRGPSFSKRLKCLQKCPLFLQWTESALATLNFACEEIHLSKGTTIDMKHQPGIYIVMGGELNVSKKVSIGGNVGKQLCTSTLLTTGAPFGMDDILINVVSPMHFKATAVSTHVTLLKIAPSQYNHLLDEKRWNTLKTIQELYSKRILQYESLQTNAAKQAFTHFVPSTDTKWLEMKESKRTKAKPAPIVNCTLQNKSHSIVATVLQAKLLQNDDINNKDQIDLHTLSAATGLEHSRTQHSPRPSFNASTKSFDRSNLWNVRTNEIYLAKRAKRYQLERDHTWMNQGTRPIIATSAQDPLLPFVASSVSWLNNPGTAVTTAAKAR